MKKIKKTYELLKINILITVLIITGYITEFFIINAGKTDYIINAYISGFLFFIYLLILSSSIKKDVLKIKKEVLYINYPASISVFFGFLILILALSAICLIVFNKDAANITFIFTFFMSTLSIIFPSVLLIVFMFFIVPAFVIPAVNIRNKKNKNLNIFLWIMFILYAGFCVYNITHKIVNINDFENQEKFKSSKITVRYSTDYLKLKDITQYAKKLMSRDKIEVPFFYTTDSFPYADYNSAEIFCRALEARVPNYLEVYHIVFNKFDTFGEQYYWTSDKDGKTPLVLHYKNMSYEIIKKPENVKPLLYCAVSQEDNTKYESKNYFYRNIKKEQKETLEELFEKPFDFEALNDFIKKEERAEKIIEHRNEEILLNKEKKHINFSVREVPKEVMQSLIQKGYSYNPSLTIKKEYEANEFMLLSSVANNTDKIRLCFYPFTEYGSLNIMQEMEIWQQSFCSPAFDLVNKTPVLKTKYDKDSYCIANGGRLPNIPELNGILKSSGQIKPNVKYWTNTKVTNHQTNESMPVLIYYKDSRFMQVKALTSVETEQAYTYCIKKPEIPSKVIANYKSRFPNVPGTIYAKQKCSDCHYYEVPDTILQQ